MIEPAWQSSGGRHAVYAGDCVETMRTLPDGCVRCCVTSPPYWGLRDYGTAKWYGGDAGCDHAVPKSAASKASSTLVGTHNQDGYGSYGQFRDTCGKCGARRIDAQLGLEATPDEYVSKMVEVFREVRRVLADDGTLWLNLGDSYAANGDRAKRRMSGDSHPRDCECFHCTGGGVSLPTSVPLGLKPKDLCGIPWRVAFALQADGWYLRQDIIWAKPNPMPESVRDRCTKAHEYIFLLSKGPRYYYDAEAIAEAADPASAKRYEYDFTGGKGRTICPGDDEGQRYRPDGPREFSGARNRRSVWTVATAPYPEAHFATYPPKLIEPCILAGSAPGDTVLDPFTGSGTTGAVAAKHGRRFIGCELNPEYIALAGRRITTEAEHLFADIA